MDINWVYKLLFCNQECFFDFLGNKKDFGIFYVVVGIVFDNYCWVLELLSSLEGIVEQGKCEVEQVLVLVCIIYFFFW